MAKTILLEIKVESEFNKLQQLEKQLRELRELKKKTAKEDDAANAKIKTQISAVSAQYNKQKKVVIQVEKAKRGLLSQYEKESATLNRLRKRLKDVILTEGSASRATRRLAKRVGQLDKRLKGVDAAAGQFQRNVGNYQSGFAGMAKNMLFAGGAAGAVVAGVQVLKRVIGDAVNTIKEFEQGNANLASVLGKSRGEIKALTDDAKRLGAVTSFSATQVTELQTEFAKLGFSEQQILDATEATLNLAAATGTDLAEAAAVAGATLGGFGLDAKKTKKVTDIMAKSFSTTALDMEKFKESMKNAAPASKAVGISVEKTTALLGVLANAGISGSKAGNNLKTSFINLNAAGLTLEEGLQKVADSQDKLGTATKLVGKNAAASFLVLADGQDDIKRLTKEFENAEGAAKKMADTQLNTLDGALKILSSSWEGLILSMGESSSAGKVMTVVVKSLTSFLTLLSGASNEVKKSQFELNAESRETIKTASANAKSNQKLIEKYEDLTNKVDLNKEEKAELNRITLDLIATFGESVAIINEETGALSINISAVKKKISADRILASEETKKLLLEKTRLEILIEKGSDASKVFERLKEQFSGEGDFSLVSIQMLELIESAKNGTLEYAITLAKIRSEFIKTGTSSTEFENTFSTIESTLTSTALAVLTLNMNQEELNKINAEFLALGIDIDEFLDEEANLLIKTTTGIKGKSKATRELIGLIEKQAKVVSDLQKEIQRAVTEEDKIVFEVELRVEQIELDRLKELGTREKVTLKIEPDIDFDSVIEKFNKENSPKIEFEFGLSEEGKKGLSDADKKAIKDSAFKLAQETSDAIFTIAQANSERRKQFEIDQLDIRNSLERDKLQSRLDGGLISQEQFENDRTVLEQKQQDKRKEIEKEAFKRKKRLDTAQTIINGAVAIAKTFATYGFTPVGAVAAIAQAVSTGIQVAVIRSQKFAKGGMIQGNSHEMGGVPIMGGRAEVEGGEAIINKKSTQLYGGLLSAINQAGGGVAFAKGGITPGFAHGGVLGGVGSLDTSGLAAEIAEGIQNIRVINVATDTIDVNNMVKNIENDVSL